MGYNTTVIILNDALDSIRRDTDFGAKLASEIRVASFRPSEPLDVSAGGFGCAARIIETHHSSDEVTVIVGHNSGRVQTPDAIKRAREEGYEKGREDERNKKKSRQSRAEARVAQLENIIRTGGAMYRAERVLLGCGMGGHDPEQPIVASSDRCRLCERILPSHELATGRVCLNFDACDNARRASAGTVEPRCERCCLPPHPPHHDAPFRHLTDDELAKLNKLCTERSYLYWWDMGSVLLTLTQSRAKLTSFVRAARAFARSFSGTDFGKFAEALNEIDPENSPHEADGTIKRKP